LYFAMLRTYICKRLVISWVNWAGVVFSENGSHIAESSEKFVGRGTGRYAWRICNKKEYLFNFTDGNVYFDSLEV